MNLTDIQHYYSSLLIAQYRTQPRAINTIELMVQEFSCDDLARIEASCFDLETAQGAQLDVIGRIVGVSRNVFGLDLTHTFFAFRRYSGSGGIGFLRYTDTPNPTILFSRYLSTAIYVMSDFEMKSLIKLKILFNTAPMTLEAVKDGLYALFAGKIDLVDNVNSTLSYSIQAPYHNVGTITAFLGNIVPKPMGVSVTITNI